MFAVRSVESDCGVMRLLQGLPFCGLLDMLSRLMAGGVSIILHGFKFGSLRLPRYD